jgi:hypothetical protein
VLDDSAPTLESSTMNTQQPVTRRHFLSAASASGVLITGIGKLNAAPSNAIPTQGETEHFWYRLAADGPYIDSQR